MERKRFFELVGASSLGIASGSNLPGFNTVGNDLNSFKMTEPKKKVLMKVGCQSGGTSKERFAQLYVTSHHGFLLYLGSAAEDIPIL